MVPSDTKEVEYLLLGEEAEHLFTLKVFLFVSRVTEHLF